MFDQPQPKASQIFLEIARSHKESKGGTSYFPRKDFYIQFCYRCGEDTNHTCIDKGLDEIYTCEKCGSIHPVRVR